jgi:hypothetical protein
MANVFTARENQKLTDVSFMTTRPGTSVTYKVYLLNDNFKDPEDGVVVAEIDRTEAKSYKYGGFHKESLGEQAILLQKGQQYSIIVQEKTPAGKYSMSFPKAKSESYLKNNRWIDGVINKNESFFFIDGSWKDLSYKENRQFLKGEQEEWSLDNFPIKGYCENSGTYIDLEKLSVSYDYPKDLVERPGGKIELGITFRGDAVRGSVPKITWTSSDESIFSVEPEADSKGKKANITGKKFGKGFVTVIAGTEDDPSKYGRIVKQVRIRKFHLADVEFPEGFEKTVYTGKPYTPQPVEVRGESETDKRRVVGKESYIVKYKNNVKCGKGSIYLEGTGDYEGVLDQIMGNPIEFVIHPAKSKINSAVTEKGKLTVKFKSQKESGITGYVLSYNEAGTKTVKEKKLPADAVRAEISGLKKGKQYEVSLKAYVAAVVYDEDVYEEVSKDFFGEASGTVKSVEAAPTLKAVQKKIAKIKGNKSLKGSTYKPLALKKGKVTKNSIGIKWKKVKGAEKYIVYGGKSGKNKFKKLAGVKGTKRAWTYKKLKANKKYKFLVLAVKKDDGVERVIASSKTICIKTRK